MNDPLFLLFLGMSIFAVIYSAFIGYILYQDAKYNKAKSKLASKSRPKK